MNRDERIVVVGAGLTGLRAAERLRELKFDGEIMILGEERLPPYHRPALSKQLLMGTLRASDLTLPAYEDINAKWRFGTPVRYLVPRERKLALPGGEEISYDGLVIATGVEARRPNDLPYHDPRVLVLRTMHDAMDLERVINSTRGRVAVVGGGFTGCELAASLRHLSREVTLIGRANNLLGNVLGDELGEWLTNTHRDHGVDLALGNSVQDWAPGPEGIALRLTDGTSLMASCVLVAAGTVPTTGWLRGSGLPLDNGVVCDPTCHVVGAEDIVAAGDVAQWPNLRFDNEPRRVEHWLNAVEMGRAAAESLLAGRSAAEPFTPMPRFWTEQYGIRIQAAGMPKLGSEIISLGTPDEGTGTVYGYSREGRLMGVVGLDCPSSVLAWTESVSRQNPVPRQRVIAAASAPRQITAGPSASPAATSESRPSSPKRRSGKHQLPVKEKQQPVRRDAIRSHDIGYVEEPSPAEVSGRIIPSPAEISGPIYPVHPAETSGPMRPLPAEVSGQIVSVGVGSGPVHGAGRPKNVMDSFSRMLPVSVRPPGQQGPGPNGRPQTNSYRPQAGGDTYLSEQNGSYATPMRDSYDNRPPVGDSFPPPARNGNGYAQRGDTFDAPPVRDSYDGPPSRGSYGPPSGTFTPASSTYTPAGPPSGSYAQAGQPSGTFAPAASGDLDGGYGPSAGHVPNGGFGRPERSVPADRFPPPRRSGQPPRPPVDDRPLDAVASTDRIPKDLLRPPAPPAPPRRQPAELTGNARHRTGGYPEPLAGRIEPDGGGLPIDVTGQMALLDANGDVRAPEPPRHGGGGNGGSGGGGRRRAEEPRGGGGRRRVEDSYDSYDRRPADVSFDRLPPVRLGGDAYDRTPPRRTHEDPYRGANANRDLHLVPAMADMDHRPGRPRHGRPDDYEYDMAPPRQRPGPADSYYNIPPAERPARAAGGGRRRA